MVLILLALAALIYVIAVEAANTRPPGAATDAHVKTEGACDTFKAACLAAVTAERDPEPHCPVAEVRQVQPEAATVTVVVVYLQ
jgi:hypothetical protein